MDRYFTPSIEDIRIGYEYEGFMDYSSGRKWTNIVAHSESLSAINKWIEEKRVRVPYLTKEQIEAEDWEIFWNDK